MKPRFHRKLVRLSLCVAVFVLAVSFPLSLTAATLDFGWGTPFILQLKGERPYLAWPIQVHNATNKRYFAQVDVVAVTDTGNQYPALTGLHVEQPVKIKNLGLLRNNIFPEVTQRAIAVFEPVDPRATVLHFYVGGVVGVSPKVQSEITYFRVTYRRTKTGWEWDGSTALE
ncbi:MAG: hypothetical protein ACE5F7_10825 [Nitrospiria bacterium]